MRGQQAILSLFPSAIETKTEQKGHRNVHIDRRDDAIAIRFYYYYHLRRWRFDDILLQLEVEFFLTTGVVNQRLALRTDYMKALTSKQPALTELKKLLPYYAWN